MRWSSRVFVTAHQHVGKPIAGAARQLAKEQITDHDEFGGFELCTMFV